MIDLELVEELLVAEGPMSLKDAARGLGVSATELRGTLLARHAFGLPFHFASETDELRPKATSTPQRKTPSGASTPASPTSKTGPTKQDLRAFLALLARPEGRSIWEVSRKTKLPLTTIRILIEEAEQLGFVIHKDDRTDTLRLDPAHLPPAEPAPPPAKPTPKAEKKPAGPPPSQTPFPSRAMRTPSPPSKPAGIEANAAATRGTRTWTLPADWSAPAGADETSIASLLPKRLAPEDT